MAFVRCRQSARRKSYQVIETYREDGRVCQRVLANLGHLPTVKQALAYNRDRLKDLEFMIAAYSDPKRIKETALQRVNFSGNITLRQAKQEIAAECLVYNAERARTRAKLERLEAVVSEK